MEQLRKVFPSVRMLTAEQVQAGEAVGDAARQALEEKTTHSRMEYRGQELYEVTALFGAGGRHALRAGAGAQAGPDHAVGPRRKRTVVQQPCGVPWKTVPQMR